MSLTCLLQPHPHLDAKLEQGVLTLCIQRSEAKNALYADLYLFIAQALEQANHNAEVRVVLLRGAHNDFTAGNDMQDFMQYIQQPPNGYAGDLPPFVLLKAAAQLTKPLIIAVSGVAIGIGVTLLLHADLVYSDSNAVFQLPFVSLGLSPEGASSQLLVQQAGYQRAAAILLSAQKFNAETAFNAGLVNQIVTDVYQHAHEQALHMAALPLAALKQTKALMKHNLPQIIQCINDEAEIFMQRVQSPETREAVQAFMQKRKPDFNQFN